MQLTDVEPPAPSTTPSNELRSRLINVASLDTPLKRVLAVGYAILIGLGLATAVQASLPGAEVTAAPGIPLSLAAAVIGGLGTALSVTLLLAGISQASVVWRAILFVPLVIWSLSIGGAQGSAQIFSIAALGLFFVIAMGLLLVIGPRIGWRRSLLASGAIVGTLALIAVAISMEALPSYAPTLVLIVLGFAIYVADVALIVTGWDVAEIGALAAAPLARRLPRLGAWFETPARLALAIVALAAASWLGHAYHGSEDWIVVAKGAGLAVVAIGIGWAVASGWRANAGEHDHVGYWGVFAIAVGLALSTALPGEVLTEPDSHSYNYNGFNSFSVVLPEGWREVTPLSRPLKERGDQHPAFPVSRTFVSPDGPFPQFTIRGAIAPPFAPAKLVDQIVPDSIDEIVGNGRLPRLPFPSMTPDGDWERGETILKGKKATLTFIYWHRDIRTPSLETNKSWHVVCAMGPRDIEKTTSTCEQIQRSVWFIPRTRPSATGKLLFGEALWAVLALCAALAAWRGWSGAGLAFLVWVGLVVVVRNAGVFALDVDKPLMDHGLSADMLCAALGLGAFAAVGAEFAFFGKHHALAAAARGAATSLVLAVLLVAGAFALYVYAGEGADKYHEIRGAVICLALTWELWTSGATMTNRDSAAFPRNARVLTFLGYLILVATCVFFFIERHAAFADVTMRAWESEGWVAFGIVNLGLAFVLMRHVEPLAVALRGALVAPRGQSDVRASAAA